MALMHSLADIRKNYSLKELSKSSVKPDPVAQFRIWLDEALTSGVSEPTAMMLATASKAGIPSARVVLLKELSPEGFVFFTNYESRKGKSLMENPVAALTFFWPGLERQVRIEGSVSKIPTEKSDLYFNSRPAGSRIGAWASPQSQEVANREVLELKEKEYSEKYKEVSEIPRPEHWGGYAVNPGYIEFWQGRPNRLHDRIVYEKQADNTWKIKRLAP